MVDVRSGIVRAVWSLPGTSIGPLAVGGGRLYINYELDHGDRLIVMDTTDGRVLDDVDIDFVGYQDRLWLDVARDRLYLPLTEGIEVRRATSLEILSSLSYPFQATDRHIVCDPEADRLYLSLSSAVYAYRASDLALLWQVETPMQRIAGLVGDVTGTFLVAQGVSGQSEKVVAEVLFYSVEGELIGQFSPDFGGQSWKLAWADAGANRVVYQGRVYSPMKPAQLRLWSTDLEGYPTGQGVQFAGGMVQVLERHPGLYVLGGRSHELVQVDGGGLEIEARVQLGVELTDLVIDQGRGRIYVNDTAAHLYELGAANPMSGKLPLRRSVVAGAGEMTLYPAAKLLLVAQAGGDASSVCVVDLDTLQVTRVITGGDQVALDMRRGRAIVGSRVSTYPPMQGENQVWDLADGELIRTIPQGGPPAYSPVRDEVYVAGYSCQAYNAETLEYVASLTPDIDAQSCKGCTGQPAVVDVSVHPEFDVLALHMVTTSAGKGPGLLPSPRFFSLDTLEPVTYTLTFLSTPGGRNLLWPPAEGRVYENLLYSRYVAEANVVVRDIRGGEVVSWRDGLALEMLTPDGRLGFARRDTRWLALDTRTWVPLGYTTRYAIHSYDREPDLLYALEGSKLYVLLPRWGRPTKTSGPSRQEILRSVRTVHVSPGYGSDETLFVVSEEAVYRSRTGGEMWERLDGGLPRVQYPAGAHLVAAVSPDYPRDHTLFVGGWGSGGEGYGVWRSTDSGDTWKPLWRGLTHLNVERVVLSQDYAEDGTLLAYCRYTDLKASESGRSLFRSTDRGEHWELVAQLSQAKAGSESLPEPEELLGEMPARDLVRAAEGGGLLEMERGGVWMPTLKLPQGEYLADQAASPDFAQDKTFYVLTSSSLYRSVTVSSHTDGGTTWQHATGPLFEGRLYDQRFTDLALATGSQGEVLLFLGDNTGQVHVARPDGLVWEPAPK